MIPMASGHVDRNVLLLMIYIILYILEWVSYVLILVVCSLVFLFSSGKYRDVGIVGVGVCMLGEGEEVERNRCQYL